MCSTILHVGIYWELFDGNGPQCPGQRGHAACGAAIGCRAVVCPAATTWSSKLSESNALASQNGQTTGRPGARVVIQDLHLSFTSARAGTIEVLRGIDLTLEPGTFCCVVGPSGCGKSTMLRIVDGLLAPQQGRITINGQEVVKPSLDRGFVFQRYNLLPWRTVAGNVEFPLENLGVDRDTRRRQARQWLELVGLGGFEDYYPSQLSGGMQQRVGLVRALAIEPTILLMDEPFGAVDDLTRMNLQHELVRLWERDHKTVIFVTHDIEEAIFLADKIVVMTPRPSQVADIIDIPFDRPRDHDLRAEPEFARMKGEIWTSLHEAGLDTDEHGAGA